MSNFMVHLNTGILLKWGKVMWPCGAGQPMPHAVPSHCRCRGLDRPTCRL